MLSRLDRLLNGITMYRVVLYALLCLAAAAIVLAAFGALAFGPLQLLASLLVLLFAAYGANSLIAWIFGIPQNHESPVITAAILFFVLSPASTPRDGALLALAAIAAMASKYALVIGRQHVFNPAAVAAVAIGIPTGIATWWIGTPAMLLPTAVAAFMVVRKVRRGELFAVTVAGGLAAAALVSAWYGEPVLPGTWLYLASGPVLFFAAFMVTEPFTAPGTRGARLAFGAFAGILSSVPLGIGPVYATPELTLLLANAGAFLTGIRRRLVLTLVSREEVAADTYSFRFATDRTPSFVAGQYLEWMVPQEAPDTRGQRRYFTIASAPADPFLEIGVKIGAQRSSFKERLLALQPGATVYGAMRGGDFTLPADPATKLAFIAGGIGVTPFRSMVRQLLARGERRDAVLLYACRADADIAYRDLWTEAATKTGLRTVYVLADDPARTGDDVEHGFLTAETVRQRLPDWQERLFYLSGPDAMVQAYKRLLREMGVPPGRIRTDYFPGF